MASVLANRSPIGTTNVSSFLLAAVEETCPLLSSIANHSGLILRIPHHPPTNLLLMSTLKSLRTSSPFLLLGPSDALPFGSFSMFTHSLTHLLEIVEHFLEGRHGAGL